MKIEIYECTFEDHVFEELTTASVCFHTLETTAMEINECDPLDLIIILNGKVIKVAFSCAGMDGRISKNTTREERAFIKALVPQYAINKKYTELV